MKIVVIGPGATGCLFVAYLIKGGGQEVWLLDKNSARAKVIKEQGIMVEGITGEWKVKVNITCDACEAGVADLIIISVKSYDTREALKHIKPLFKATSLVLTLQNGLGNAEIISEVVPPENVLGGITNQGVTSLGFGKIRHAGSGETTIGRLDGKIPVELCDIRELFNKAGLVTLISKDIKALIWSKLIINVGINALTAITRLKNGKLIEFEGTRKILEDAVAEAVRVARRKRVRLIYDDPLSKAEAVCQATSENISSMLQDVLKSKRTEIDFINGMIVRYSQELGIAVPVNTVLTNLVKTIEVSYGCRQ